MNTFLWIAVVALCLVLQGMVLHVLYRRKFAAQQAARMQFQQTMNGKLEQTKRQIGQLQSELKATRQHVRLLRTNDAPSVPGNFKKEVMNALADLGEKMGADPASWSRGVPD